jgi:PAS domain-containing protein
MKAHISLVGVSPHVRAAFRQRDRELEETHRIARLGTWSWTRSTDVVTWSAEVYRIFSLDPGFPRPRYEELLQLYSPESRKLRDDAVRRAIELGEPCDLDVEIHRPDDRSK